MANVKNSVGATQRLLGLAILMTGLAVPAQAQDRHVDEHDNLDPSFA